MPVETHTQTATTVSGVVELSERVRPGDLIRWKKTQQPQLVVATEPGRLVVESEHKQAVLVVCEATDGSVQLVERETDAVVQALGIVATSEQSEAAVSPRELRRAQTAGVVWAVVYRSYDRVTGEYVRTKALVTELAYESRCELVCLENPLTEMNPVYRTLDTVLDVDPLVSRQAFPDAVSCGATVSVSCWSMDTNEWNVQGTVVAHESLADGGTVVTVQPSSATEPMYRVVHRSDSVIIQQHSHPCDTECNSPEAWSVVGVVSEVSVQD